MSTAADFIRTIEVQGCQIRYQEKGAGDPVLYLHGYMGMEPWGAFLEELARHYRVIAVEHPGFGESKRPEWLKTMDDLAFFYLDILDALSIRRTSVVGHSLGGWLAADFASRYDSRVDNLILVGAMGLHLLSEPMADIFLLSTDAHKKLRYSDPDRIPDVEEEFLMTARAQAMSARLGWNPRFHDPKLIHRLHRIRVPSLLVWGEEDRIVPLTYARRYQELIPHAQLRTVPRAGHVPQEEKGETCGRIVLEFLEQSQRKQGAEL